MFVLTDESIDQMRLIFCLLTLHFDEMEVKQHCCYVKVQIQKRALQRQQNLEIGF